VHIYDREVLICPDSPEQIADCHLATRRTASLFGVELIMATIDELMGGTDSFEALSANGRILSKLQPLVTFAVVTAIDV
jgi:hypothetical protein